MHTERNPAESLVDGNKNETELPIGRAETAAPTDTTTWQCADCGTIGRLRDTLPDRCPDCTAPREQLYYRQED